MGRLGETVLLNEPRGLTYRQMQSSSDEELMTHLRGGHHDALAVIVDRYQRLVWSVAQKIVHDESEAEDGDAYGAITSAIVDVMRDYGRKVNVPFLASQLELRRVPIRAKDYKSAVRTAVRRLFESGKLKRLGTGYYRLDKNAEAHDNHQRQ